MAALSVSTQAVAQPLAVAPPRLDDLTHKIFVRRRRAGDEAGIEKAGRRQPGTARISGAFGQGADCWFDAQVVFPEWVTDDLADPGRGQLALVQKEQVDFRVGRKLAATI